MSMPFTIYECSTCGFKGFSSAIWGSFSYVHDSQRLPVSRALGWCDECKALVPVETLPSADAQAKRRAKVAEELAAFEMKRREAMSRQGFLARLLRLPPRLAPDIKDRLVELGFMKDDLQVHDRLFEALRDRKSPPRCLDCGSLNARPLSELGQVPIHPGCGGKLNERGSEARISIRPKVRTYDLEGRMTERAST